MPAVVISPFIPKGTIDHRVYDHASIPATLEALADLAPLTQRDAAANNLTSLLSLAVPRKDTLYVLPDPATDGVANAKMAPPSADTSAHPIGYRQFAGFFIHSCKTGQPLEPAYG